MKLRILSLTFTLLMGFTTLAISQSLMISRYIMVTDTITDEEVTFAASSDDKTVFRLYKNLKLGKH